MMYQELVTEIEKLPLDEQLSLLETLARFISRRTAKPAAPENSLQRVQGLLKPDPGQAMPTDAELMNDYADYLIEKYA